MPCRAAPRLGQFDRAVDAAAVTDGTDPLRIQLQMETCLLAHPGKPAVHLLAFLTDAAGGHAIPLEIRAGRPGLARGPRAAQS